MIYSRLLWAKSNPKKTMGLQLKTKRLKEIPERKKYLSSLPNKKSSSTSWKRLLQSIVIGQMEFPRIYKKLHQETPKLSIFPVKMMDYMNSQHSGRNNFVRAAAVAEAIRQKNKSKTEKFNEWNSKKEIVSKKRFKRSLLEKDLMSSAEEINGEEQTSSEKKLVRHSDENFDTRRSDELVENKTNSTLGNEFYAANRDDLERAKFKIVVTPDASKKHKYVPVFHDCNERSHSLEEEKPTGTSSALIETSSEETNSSKLEDVNEDILEIEKLEKKQGESNESVGHVGLEELSHDIKSAIESGSEEIDQSSEVHQNEEDEIVQVAALANIPHKKSNSSFVNTDETRSEEIDRSGEVYQNEEDKSVQARALGNIPHKKSHSSFLSTDKSKSEEIDQSREVQENEDDKDVQVAVIVNIPHKKSDSSLLNTDKTRSEEIDQSGEVYQNEEDRIVQAGALENIPHNKSNSSLLSTDKTESEEIGETREVQQNAEDKIVKVTAPVNSLHNKSQSSFLNADKSGRSEELITLELNSSHIQPITDHITPKTLDHADNVGNLTDVKDNVLANQETEEEEEVSKTQSFFFDISEYRKPFNFEDFLKNDPIFKEIDLLEKQKEKKTKKRVPSAQKLKREDAYGRKSKSQKGSRKGTQKFRPLPYVIAPKQSTEYFPEQINKYSTTNRIKENVPKKKQTSNIKEPIAKSNERKTFLSTILNKPKRRASLSKFEEEGEFLSKHFRPDIIKKLREDSIEEETRRKNIQKEEERKEIYDTLSKILKKRDRVSRLNDEMNEKFKDGGEPGRSYKSFWMLEYGSPAKEEEGERKGEKVL